MQPPNLMDEPDRVNAVVEGYFRIPAIWIGEAPEAENSGITVSRTVVLKRTLSCGIEAYAMRNGQFLFDFLRSSVAGIVRVPGYSARNNFLTASRERTDAAEMAEQASLLRAQIMNVHQACLTSAEALLKMRVAAMGFPITPWSTDATIGIGHPIAYHDDTESAHALARNVLDGKYFRAFLPLQRRVMEVEVVERSFQALDEIISLEDGRYIPIIEAAYQSASRAAELRLGESIAIGWTACEQLISLEWKKMISENGSGNGVSSRISRDRRKKLEGRDYTASVMVEMLELFGCLSDDLYKNLETARKARNNWAHDMRVPSGSDVLSCIQSIQALLSKKGIVLALQTGFRGPGGAAWTIESFHRIHGKDIPGFGD